VDRSWMHGEWKVVEYSRLFFAIAFIILVTECAKLFPTPIGKILDNVRVFDGKQVIVQGEVTETFGASVLGYGINYFKVKDKTGEIAVITKRSMPKKGQKVKVRGTVKEAFSIGEESLTVITEK